MANFSLHIPGLVQKEGGYISHQVANDRGGLTYAGISINSNPDWSGWQYVNANQHPPKELVHSLYKAKYWDVMMLDDVKHEIVASVLFSSCVLSGHRTATRLAQTVVQATVDGAMGPNTMKAINAEDPEKFVMGFSLARIARFCAIVGKNRSQTKFLRGWVLRCLREVAEAGEIT